MKIQEIINGILAYHPDIGDRRTCDGAFGADPNVECTGILVAIAPTVPIIRKAIEIGANFIFVHEPTFYSAYDDTCGWLEGNPVYEEKMSMLRDNGIVIFRDHDHIHCHKPDGIFHYMIRQLGWSEYTTPGLERELGVVLPETTLGELVRSVKKAMNLEHIRFIGDVNAKVSTVGFCGHLLPNAQSNWSNNNQVAASWNYDVIIPGETVDWTVPLYFYDAAALGYAKGMIIPGHFVQEEAGIRWAPEWLRGIVGDNLKITFCPTGCLYQEM